RGGGALLWAGAWGNFIDRFAYGYVLDFLELPRFPVFNLADAAVVVGAVLLAVGLVWRDA
ncbi:TPA: signal peptidase II, partial [Candidatus Bipolaricaulota bacterium]|nr:signal peptidase II [Candidatus Bipolaricaulota bacterium]